MKLRRFIIWKKIIAVTIICLFGLVLQQNKATAEIDSQRDVYLFLHGREDLQEKAVNKLVAYGFSKEKIIRATPNKVGEVGDYMAMLWKPPEPDYIKIQLIIEVKKVDPEKIVGLWKGVTERQIDIIPLE